MRSFNLSVTWNRMLEFGKNSTKAATLVKVFVGFTDLQGFSEAGYRSFHILVICNWGLSNIPLKA